MMSRELCEKSINDLFLDSSNKCKYVIPIYQRNYAWGKNEIDALINDIYDAYNNNVKNYYIGTLVTHNNGDNEYEIIDGQQRLTTIYLLLNVLQISIVSELTYKSRSKSIETLKKIHEIDELKDRDERIISGYKFAKNLCEKIEESKREKFDEYFKNNVKIIHYEVPKDVDLNSYFEIMNSRGEQLEKHEILKASLMGSMKTANGDIDTIATKRFAEIWDACSQMGKYIQITYKNNVFKDCQIIINKDKDNYNVIYNNNFNCEGNDSKNSIRDMIENCLYENKEIRDKNNDEDKNDYYFQPIIDFPNFLLIVLKILKYIEKDFVSDNRVDVILNDNELLKEFEDITWDTVKVKMFGYYLLKAKYYLDNFVVHQLISGKEKNPWALKKYNIENVKNRTQDEDMKNRIVQILSMFQVTYDTMTRKNYLFYCLYYLIKQNIEDNDDNIKEYQNFVEKLADKYFYLYYMKEEEPNSFDSVILKEGSFAELNNNDTYECDKVKFSKLFVDGENNVNKKDIPLFVFNYLDYKLWRLYYDQIRSDDNYKNNKDFFINKLGIANWDKDNEIINKSVFQDFYFSSTRNSLEHFFPRARINEEKESLNSTQIDCFGNYAYIGSSTNSSGSDWLPNAKVKHYLDSKKIDQVSISSLKFKIMMQICDIKEKWEWEEIQEHQNKMLDILFGI